MSRKSVHWRGKTWLIKDLENTSGKRLGPEIHHLWQCDFIYGTSQILFLSDRSRFPSTITKNKPMIWEQEMIWGPVHVFRPRGRERRWKVKRSQLDPSVSILHWGQVRDQDDGSNQTWTFTQETAVTLHLLRNIVALVTQPFVRNGRWLFIYAYICCYVGFFTQTVVNLLRFSQNAQC